LGWKEFEYFEFLENLKADQVIPAGYNAIQFIRQWARASAAAGVYASLGPSAQTARL
jgi:hypothetical protein